MLRKVISGAQSGADLAALEVAKKFGYDTGGVMPFGYKTLEGFKPQYKEMYGLTAHSSSSYVPRTRRNVQDSDGTIRFAYNFESRGEICTLNAIEDYKKPHIDVDLNDLLPILTVTNWISCYRIEVLNIAGNSEQTSPGTHEATTIYLEKLFQALKDDENAQIDSQTTDSQTTDAPA